MIFDDPNEVKEHGRTITMTEGFYRRIDRVESELLIEVPYFVVRDRGIAAVKSLRDRGVHIRVLTNSLASNDVLVAHAGHAEKRKELIAAGVELYELRSDPAVEEEDLSPVGFGPIVTALQGFRVRPQGRVHRQPQSRSPLRRYQHRGGSLHREPGTGSPGDLVHGRGRIAAKQLPGSAWTRMIISTGSPQTDGKTERYDHDPNSTVWQRAKVRIIQMLPIRDQI